MKDTVQFADDTALLVDDTPYLADDTTKKAKIQGKIQRKEENN